MTTSRRADKRDDDLVDGNDRRRGPLKPAPTSNSAGDTDRACEQPHRSRVITSRPRPARKRASSEQPGPYVGWPRDFLNFCRWAAKDKEAQDGVDQLLKSFARHVLWPVGFMLILLIVAVVLFETMPDTSPTVKIIASSVTVASIILGGRLSGRSKKQTSIRRPHEVVSDNLTDDQPVSPENSG